MECGATKRRSGQPCKAKAMTNGRCRIHGGKTPLGPASPNFKHGRYSKYLPARMAARYHEAVSDSKLLELREEVALVDARIVDLLGRVDTGESGATWQALKSKFVAFGDAHTRGDAAAVTVTMAELATLIDEGLADFAIWRELRELLHDRRRLVESERKRLVEMDQMITAERAMLLLGVVVDVVRRHVNDRGTLQNISFEIERLINTSGTTPARIEHRVQQAGDGPARAVQEPARR